jgi:DNA-binding MarR family transcriptional regulator
MSREELIWAIIDGVRRNQVLTDMLDESVAKLMGVNRTDYRALDVIDQNGRISAGDLARELRMSTGAVTTLVDRLERAGYARRVPDPEDRRRVLIEPTSVVHEGAAQLYGSPQDILAGYDDWSDEELEAVLRFQQFGREWLEGRLARLDELKRTQQLRPAGAAAKRSARSRRRPS